MASTIDPLSSLMNSNSAASAASTAASGGASKDEFLKLLVAQLRYQDPMSPQDNTQFVSELAQFSALEQQTQTNSILGNVVAGQVAAQRASYANFIGKSMTAKTSAITYDGVKPPPLTAHFDSKPASAQMIVSDVNGSTVATIDLGAATIGDNPIKWDGTDGSGHPLAAGSYQVAIKASDAKGADISAAGYVGVQGLVTGLTFSTDGAHFLVGGVTVSPADIISVN